MISETQIKMMKTYSVQNSMSDIDQLLPELRKGFIANDHPRAKNGSAIPGIYTKFVHTPFVTSIEYINEAHKERKKLASEALKSKGLAEYLLYIEKPYRMEELIKHFSLVGRGEEDYDLITEVWCDVENLHEYRELLDHFVTGISVAFSEELRFDKDVKLEEDGEGFITLYRGYDISKNPKGKGHSYTVSEKIARWFANRLVQHEDCAEIKTIRVKRKDIAFTTNRRNELEVVVAEAISNHV